MNLVRWKNPSLTKPANLFPTWYFDEDFWPQSFSEFTLYETEDNVIAKVGLAGVPAENINVTVEGGVLTIKRSLDDSEEAKEESAKPKQIKVVDNTKTK